MSGMSTREVIRPSSRPGEVEDQLDQRYRTRGLMEGLEDARQVVRDEVESQLASIIPLPHDDDR